MLSIRLIHNLTDIEPTNWSFSLIYLNDGDDDVYDDQFSHSAVTLIISLHLQKVR